MAWKRVSNIPGILHLNLICLENMYFPLAASGELLQEVALFLLPHMVGDGSWHGDVTSPAFLSSGDRSKQEVFFHYKWDMIALQSLHAAVHVSSSVFTPATWEQDLTDCLLQQWTWRAGRCNPFMMYVALCADPCTLTLAESGRNNTG